MTSTSNTRDEDEPKQLPSYEDLRRAGQPVYFSVDAKRIFWPLNGPLTTSIGIMEDVFTPDSREPYFNTDGTWHSASQSPFTEPKVPSITVHVDDLDQWESQWLDIHRDHSDPDGGEEYGPWVKYGELPDYDSEEEDSDGPPHLLMCCGTQRPRGKAVTVVVRSSGEFVTIHDYLRTVHPWLLGLREDLLGAMAVFDDEPLPTETKIVVGSIDPENLMMDKEAEWIDRRRRRKPALGGSESKNKATDSSVA